MKSIKSLSQNSKNKGFTLVELLVVIVIIAILMSVSIAGYNKYIGQARVNTDLQTCDVLKSVLVNTEAEEGVYEELLRRNYDGSNDLNIEIIWDKEDIIIINGVTREETKVTKFFEENGTEQETVGAKRLLWHANRQLPDGLPFPQQTGYQFHVKVKNSGEGMCKVVVTCEPTAEESKNISDTKSTTMPSL